MGKRVYDPSSRIFLQPDLLLPFAYAYANGDPINGIDPLGLWTIQLGVSAAYTFPWGASFVGFTGLAFDSHGTISYYKGLGYGFGIGAGGSIGLNVALSNADTTKDLGGPFLNVSAGLGDGADATVDVFTDLQKVLGGEISGGVGLGLTTFVGEKGTEVHDLWCGEDGCPNAPPPPPTTSANKWRNSH